MKSFGIVAAILVLAFVLVTCSKDSPTDSADTTAPGAIVNLTILGTVDTTAILAWTAPGDNGYEGTAGLYDIRFATDSIVLRAWNDANAFLSPPKPIEAGQMQQTEIVGLSEDSSYFFALKSIDEKGNISPISNIARESQSSNPTVSISRPSSGESVADLVAIEAIAFDDKGILKIDFYVDAQFKGTVVAPPYIYQWNASSQTHGSNHVTYAVAWDVDSNTTTSSTVTFAIDTALGVPSPVTLLPPGGITDSSASLTWSSSTESDFSRYLIQYDYSADRGTSWQTIKTITAMTDTIYTVSLHDNWMYSFRVIVQDLFGRQAVSNIEEVATENIAPTSVNISRIDREANASVLLVWNRNYDWDFQAYQIYESDDSLITVADQLITEISDVAVVQYIHTPTDSLLRKFYGVVVMDTSGLSNSGNVIAGSARPEPVDIVGVVTTEHSIQVDWNESTDDHFALYRIELDTVAGFENPIQSMTVTSISQNVADFGGLLDSKLHYTQVTVLDRFGFQASSPIENTTTINAPPPASIITGTPEPFSNISLAWSQASIHDFARYEIHRSLDSTDLNGLIASIEDSDSMEFVDFAVDSGAVYFYEVRLFDTGGLSSNSNTLRMNFTTGYALQFDGTGGSATIGGDPASTENYTMEMWIYWQNTTRVETPLQKANNLFELELHSNNTLVARTGCGSTGLLFNPIPSFQWIHIAITMKTLPSPEARIYVNGSHVGTLACDNYQITTGNINLGGTYTGYIDELRIWNYTRTHTDITTNMNKVIKNAPGLVGQWSFDEGSGSTFSGTGATGTISGATWIPSTAPLEY